MGLTKCLAAVLCLSMSGVCVAQSADSKDGPYSRKNGWTIFAEYSNTSTHMLMGAARQRRLVTLGGAYTRRVARFADSQLNFQAEVRPVVFESDPLSIATMTDALQTTTGPLSFTTIEGVTTTPPCQPASGMYSLPPSPGISSDTITYSTVCGRQWTFAQAFSPLGFKYSLMTDRRIQPFVIGTLGYMYSSRPIPLADAEAFNFEFDFGAGVEMFRSKTRSVSIECRFHHFSNRDTAEENPGVDNLMYKVSYSFGR
ncbi:MAG TPA: acyloxyacyl hydrolase [Candidatus Aquilonibacter sp.]|nr:acyloxyacyl hydrolase [Candidatus Aquilonibacter sp.]